MTPLQQRLDADPDIRDLLETYAENKRLRELNRWLFYSVMLMFFGLLLVGGKLFQLLG